MNWQLHNRIEKDFERSMKALFRQVTTAIGKEVDPSAISRKLKSVSAQPVFQEAAANMALTMTTNVNTTGSKNWREAARKAGRGSELYSRIQFNLQDLPAFFEKVRENALYISSAPWEIAEWITDQVQKEGLRGRRASDIAGDILARYPQMLESRAGLIARTEVSKTQLALAQTRSVSLGINWYIWRTAMDSRRRHAHKDMEGVLIAWDRPPNPEALFPYPGAPPYDSYHAGGTFNCRCYAEPLVSLDVVEFPARVHTGGQIITMTRADFEKLPGVLNTV